MSDYLRIRASRLQMPIRRYIHESGHRITLAGMMHVGEARYYAEVRGIIDKLEAGGALVQREGAGLHTLTDDDLAGVAPEVKQAVSELRRCEELNAKRVAELGWITQFAAIGHPATWQNIDLGVLDMIGLMGPGVVIDRFRRMSNLLDWEDGDSRAPHVFRLQVALTFRLTSIGAIADKVNTEPIVLERRNQVALAGVDDAMNKAANETGSDVACQDIVLVWGAGHLNGLDKGLRERGYTPIETTWHTACKLPSITRAAVSLFIRGKFRSKRL